MTPPAVTVTRPILGQNSAAASRPEIIDSWARLKAETRSTVPLFAYPNGLPGDFGASARSTC
jgi:hypothetical protein